MIELPSVLRRSLKKCDRSPTDAFECFFNWYNDAWLMADDLWLALDSIPRPIREIMVTHQAWGMMSSGGPNAYYWRFDSRFDDEMRRGLVILGCSENFTALEQGRKLFTEQGDQGLVLEESGDVYDQLISLEELEELIGKFLFHAAKTK